MEDPSLNTSGILPDEDQKKTSLTLEPTGEENEALDDAESKAAAEQSSSDNRRGEEAHFFSQWLAANIQLNGFTVDEDWTAEHTKEFTKFCNDASRKYWFLWMAGASTHKIAQVESTASGQKRLHFSNEPPLHGISAVLQVNNSQQEGGNGVVVLVKKTLSVVNFSALKENLLCLSFQGSILEQVAAFVRGICIPALASNTLWPQSYKKDIVRKVR